MTVQHTLYTIGYEGIPPSTFKTVMELNDIDYLIDTRAVPQSRKAGFSKQALVDAFATKTTTYCIGEGLGNPKAGRDAAKRGDTAEFHRIYKAHLQTPPAQALVADIVRRVVKEGKRICLMCYEKDPTTCHRSLIAEEVRCMAFMYHNHPMEVIDLFEDITVDEYREKIQLQLYRKVKALEEQMNSFHSKLLSKGESSPTLGDSRG